MIVQVDGNDTKIHSIKQTLLNHYLKISQNIEPMSLEENKLLIWVSDIKPSKNYHVWCRQSIYTKIEDEKTDAEKTMKELNLHCIISKHKDALSSRYLVFNHENKIISLHNDNDLNKFLVLFAQGFSV